MTASDIKTPDTVERIRRAGQITTYLKQVIHIFGQKWRFGSAGSQSENVNTSEITGPLLATREAALADSVLATTLALSMEMYHV